MLYKCHVVEILTVYWLSAKRGNQHELQICIENYDLIVCHVMQSAGFVE